MCSRIWNAVTIEQAFVGDRLQELENVALHRVETHLAAGADKIPVQVDAFGGYARFP